MFNLNRNTKRGPIGLDLGANSVKMIQLRENGHGLRAIGFGKWSAPDGSGGDPAELRTNMIAAIRDVYRNSPFKGRRVNSALRCDELAIKTVRLPRMSGAELDKAVLWEARDRFDFDVTADRLGYLRAGEVRQGDETTDEIIMLAVRREVLNDHVELLHEAGLSPEHIEVAPLALFRVFQQFRRRRRDENAVSVVVDVGDSATRVVVGRGGDVSFLKRIDIGGRRLNQAVADQLNLDYREAKELRHRMRDGQQEAGEPLDEGSEVSWSVRDAVRGEAEALAREVSLCLRYCLVTFRGLRPKSITLTGGEAYDAALVDVLGKNLNVACEIGRPLEHVDLSGDDLAANRRAAMCEWAVAAGLAVRDLETNSDRESEDAEHRLSA